MQTQEQTTLNAKLVHFTKEKSPDKLAQVAFAVTDDEGKEAIITVVVKFQTNWRFIDDA